jgi:hypothetical protein
MLLCTSGRRHCWRAAELFSAARISAQKDALGCGSVNQAWPWNNQPQADASPSSNDDLAG